MSNSHKSLIWILTASFVCLLFFSSASTAESEMTWSIQTLDEKGLGYGNGYCPIAIDSNGNAHIAYSSRYPNHLSGVMYASWNGSDWKIQTVSSEGDACSLVLDKAGNPHIVYSTGDLFFASWTGENWSIQEVASGGRYFGVVALDSLENPHIAYTNSKTLYYTSWTGSNWSTQTIVDYPYMTPQLSLAFDKNDTPYIYYNGNTPNGYITYVDLKLASFHDGNWNIQDIATAGGYGNMVLDSKGYPHLIYKVDYPQFTGTDNSTLVYAHWNGTVWMNQTVISNSYLTYALEDGRGAFLSLDSYDYPHVSYVADGRVTYARWTGRAWNVQTVRNYSSTVDSCYQALDSKDNPHLSYREGGLISSIRNIVYATTNDTTPIFTPQSTSITSASEPIITPLMQIIVIVFSIVTVLAIFVLYRLHRKQ